MTKVCHITHIRNLDAILKAGGLWSPNHRPDNCRPDTSIAHANIQARRARRAVPLHPGGVLHDYVPFYLGVRSPMLYANHMGGVPSNTDGQEAIIYLVSSIEAVSGAGLPWLFTDGHAEVDLTEFFDDLDRLKTLDWEAINARSWADSPDDPDRKRRKQAEFLVHRFVPLELMLGIAVCSENSQGNVKRILAGSERKLPVALRPLWYY